jgi:hypothetical protein
MEEPINPATGLSYTTQLPDLSFLEYGRNVQRMVDYAISIETRDERSKCARTIIEAMALLNPTGKESADYKQKLWDQLHIMADFKLDIESPYPVPERNTLESKPERIPYPGEGPRFKHYGEILEGMIKAACEINSEDERQSAILNIANLMKRFYVVWNKDHVPDEVIWEHLKTLSKGKLFLEDPAKLNQVHDAPKHSPHHGGGAKRKKGRNQQRRKF